ncbi:MAG: Mut7-C RNAse domain-containing protein [Desulfobacterales bacterium]|nr:MAG: Mut7-C RNAse domain-containing protein [Desulfobacterales bacterium]
MPYAFVAEATLGKLARWLRIMGFDTIYSPATPNKEWIEDKDKTRILLTRTRKVKDLSNAQTRIFIVSDKPFEQLKEVIHSVGIVPEDIKLFFRCLRCNIPIQPIDKKHVQRLVPDHILETHHLFQTCTGCGRIYWPGTHTENSREVIKKLFE